jgi:hypothetical protein
MNQEPNKYQEYSQKLDELKKEKEINHTIYISRRAIWANVILSFTLSCLAAYIHTRRWKAMGIFTIFMIIFMIFTGIEDDLKKSFEKGQTWSPLMSLIACIDNGIAIKKARQKVQQSNPSDR